MWRPANPPKSVSLGWAGGWAGDGAVGGRAKSDTADGARKTAGWPGAQDRTSSAREKKNGRGKGGKGNSPASDLSSNKKPAGRLGTAGG